MSRPLADVILVSWNSREDTLRAVESVRQCIAEGESDGPVGIRVVDNGSRDGTAEALESRFPDIRVIRMDRNTGFTGGIRAGVAESRAEFLIFLNNDAVVEPGWLAALLRMLRPAPDDVVAAGGRILDTSGTLADFVGGIMTFDGHGFQPGFRRPLNEVAEPASGAEIFFACGGNMIVKRRRFLDLGGFDDDFFAYLEDVDFGWRVWSSGSRIVYSREAAVRHKSSATSQRLGNYERGVLFERNALATILKNVEDELLAEFAGPVFFALLHRLHRYTLDRSSRAGALGRTTLGEASEPGSARGPWSWLGRLFRRRERAVIDDPLAIMQFRAVEWFFRHQQDLMGKRAVIQTLRRRSDREIFDQFPIHFVPTYPADERLMASPWFRALMPDVPFEEKTLDEILGP